MLLYEGGTVCDDDFNKTTADAICKEMGYDGAIPGDKSWTSHEVSKREGNMWLIQDTYDKRLMTFDVRHRRGETARTQRAATIVDTTKMFFSRAVSGPEVIAQSVMSS